MRTSAGVRLNVEIDGAEDAPVTVILAHGWTLDSRSWAPVASALTASQRPLARVIRYDHRAHGRSDSVARADMTIEALADDLAEVISQLAPTGPLVLGGHSMGGMAVMALAEQHPELVAERVAGVALVSTAAGGLADTTLGLSESMLRLVRRGEAKLADAAWVDRRAMLSRRPRVIAPAARALLIGPGADRGAVMATARSLASCRPAAMVGFRPTLNAHERHAALAAFAHIPVEVSVGTRDKLTPVGQSRRIVASLETAQLNVYPGAGHMLPLERVAGVSAKLAGLVSRAGQRVERAEPVAPETRSAERDSGQSSVVHHGEVS
jgi:pimeloyl-ACP methyl ester carboxylesterase